MTKKASSGRGNKKFISIGVGVAAAVLAVVIVLAIAVGYQSNGITKSGTNAGGSNSVGTQSNSTNSENKLALSSLLNAGSPSRGDRNAPVTLVEFGDFQCHFCARFATQTESRIYQQYISTGKVNMIFKHFAWYGPDSLTAAIASQCANDQGKFWEFHDILYQNQGETNSGWAGKDNLKKFASQVDEGLDRTQFDSCLDSGKYKSYVESDKALGTSLGFEGTPGFIVEKRDGSSPVPINGAYPFATFQQAIDQELLEK